jgi:serine/threonine protein kinase
LPASVPRPADSNPAASSWRAGAVIGGRYRLVKLMGRGAMAEVWRAEHVTLRTPVAVKLVSVKGDPAAEETLARFLQEAQAAAQLRSPHVVQIFDHGQEGAAGYIAMELLEGESLRDRMERLRVIPPVELGRIVAQLARSLSVAHAAGVVHRDLKPQNVILARDQGREVVKIVDFGIAKRLDLGALDKLTTQDGFMVGTPSYMSPEQITSSRPIDARSDLWALAVVTFEGLCGRRPFDAPTVGELMVSICSKPAPVPSTLAAVPAGFDAWFARAIEHQPELRFQSAIELADTLCAVLAPGTTAATLADASPPWAAPPPGSEPGLLDRSGVLAQSGVIRTVPRAARRSSFPPAAPPAAPGLRRAVLTLVLVALPVALITALGGVWLASPTGPIPPPAPWPSGSTPEGSIPLPAAPSAATAAAPSEGSSAGSARPERSAAPRSSAATDDGAAPDALAPEARPDGGGRAPTKTPRRQRPEEILGI